MDLKFLQETWCIDKLSKHLHILFLVHYSFDFAQQLHYPHDPMQPGHVLQDISQVFGIVTEGLPQMVNFLEGHHWQRGQLCDQSHGLLF